MEDVRTSTRVLLVSAIILLVILLTGPLGYKFGLVPLQPSLVSLLVAMAGGLLVVLAALVYVVLATRAGLPRNRNLLLVAIVLGVIPAVIVGPQMSRAGVVPAIHDITTDTDNPPAFVALKTIRENAPNGAEYGAAEGWSPETLAATTREAYPDIQPIVSALSVDSAVQQAASTLQAMGLEVIDVNPADGRIEATATTFWFGFKDDMVIRVVPTADGSRVDIRSMSRVGQSDVGANAARIARFTQMFDG